MLKKLARSSVQHEVGAEAVTEACLGALFTNANSPKESPGPSRASSEVGEEGREEEEEEEEGGGVEHASLPFGSEEVGEDAREEGASETEASPSDTADRSVALLCETTQRPLWIM